LLKLVSSAFSDLRRQHRIVIQYVIITTSVLTLFRLVSFCMFFFELPVNAPLVASLLRIVLALYLAITLSGVQSICFAALGVEVARPMWKCKGWRDAVQRFFMPWLIINLLLITLMDIRMHLFSVEESEIAAMLELMVMAAHLLSLPAGAAIMFWGGLNWRELPLMLAPLARFLTLTLIPVGVGLLQYILIGLRAALLDGTGLWGLAVYTLTDIPLVLLDGFIFTLAWRICLHDKATPKDADDSPFDF